MSLQQSELHPSTALPFILVVVSRRHTTLCTTLDIGLGVGWRDCIVVRHLSDSFSCYGNHVLSFLLYVLYSCVSRFISRRI